MKSAALGLAAAVLFLTGCQTTSPHREPSLDQAILAEPQGDYYVGRRMYKKDYKMWGWVREPGKPWRTAKLVMLNEQQMLAPDRAQNRIGSDNNFEYWLRGRFSGETVYEPASDGFYPEFILTGYELISTAPPNIYVQKRQNDPAVRLLQAPR